MTRQCGDFLQGGIFPHNDLVIGVPMRTDELFCGLGEDQIADLGPRVDTVQHCAVERVPKLDGPVSRPSARSQHTMVMWVPCETLNSSTVLAKLVHWHRGVRVPDHQFVIIATRCQRLAIEGPFQPTYLLGMALIDGHNFSRTYPRVVDIDGTISGPTC